MGSGLKATEQDRLYLSGAIHRMGERTGSAAERILDDLDTLLAENAKLRAAEAALRGMLRAHPNCHAVDCGGYGCDDDCLGGDLHVCECGAITARNAARAALGEP